jgi:hypothetical protein
VSAADIFVTAVMASVFAAGTAIVAWFLWEMVCIHRGGKQRLLLIDAAFSRADWPEMDAFLHAVSFRQHWRALAFFRDPFKLYDPRLIARLTPSNLEKATS